jgi:hypothetical protein
MIDDDDDDDDGGGGGGAVGDMRTGRRDQGNLEKTFPNATLSTTNPT